MRLTRSRHRPYPLKTLTGSAGTPPTPRATRRRSPPPSPAPAPRRASARSARSGIARGAREGTQCPLHVSRFPFPTYLRHARALRRGERLVVGPWDGRDHLIVRVLVHADDHALSRLDRALLGVRAARDRFLKQPPLDRARRATRPLDLLEQRPRVPLYPIRQRFHIPAATSRIDRFGNTGLVRQNLLRPERQRGALFRRQRQGFVVRIGVQRLRPPEHGRERLDRHPYHVVLGLLRRQRRAPGLGVEPQPTCGVVRVKILLHETRP